MTELGAGFLKLAKALACCLLLFPLVGTGPRSVPRPRAKSLNLTGPSAALRETLLARMTEAYASFRAGRYQEAQQIFESTLNQAVSRSELDLAAAATSNLGGCQFARRQYHSALDYFLKGYRLAQKAHDTDIAAMCQANIASLYS